MCVQLQLSLHVQSCGAVSQQKFHVCLILQCRSAGKNQHRPGAAVECWLMTPLHLCWSLAGTFFSILKVQNDLVLSVINCDLERVLQKQETAIIHS